MNLREKIVKIMKAGALEKDAQMQAVGKYKYHSIDGVADHLRKQFVKYGITFTYQVLSNKMKITDNGTFVIVKELEMCLTDAESGETITGTEIGVGIDKNDKASGKSTSYAIKTWLTATFMLKGNPDENDAIVPVVAERASTDETTKIRARVVSLGVDEARFLKAADAASFEAIPASRIPALNQMLDQKEKQQ